MANGNIREAPEKREDYKQVILWLNDFFPFIRKVVIRFIALTIEI